MLKSCIGPVLYPGSYAPEEEPILESGVEFGRDGKAGAVGDADAFDSVLVDGLHGFFKLAFA